MRVCVVGDIHASKNGPSLERIDWIAEHVAATEPDALVLMGDQCSFDSCSKHEVTGGRHATAAPTIEDDFASTEEVLERLDGLPAGVKLHALMGNHENRLAKFEAADKRLDGALWPRLTALYEAYGWDVTDYGSFLNLGDGVRFTHAPMNAGRGTYSNWTTLARDLTWDLVWAHTHKFQQMNFPKIEGGVSILNVGCALPQGHVENYAKLSPTSWWYGIVDVELNQGRIGGYSRREMNWLRKTYG
jgi:predicted MPP superfamily phosphohydrolase